MPTNCPYRFLANNLFVNDVSKFYNPVMSTGVCGAFLVDVCRNSGQRLVSDGAGLRGQVSGAGNVEADWVDEVKDEAASPLKFVKAEEAEEVVRQQH